MGIRTPDLWHAMKPRHLRLPVHTRRDQRKDRRGATPGDAEQRPQTPICYPTRYPHTRVTEPLPRARTVRPRPYRPDTLGRDRALISTRRRKRLVERRQQHSDRGAYFAGQRATLIEIDRMCPGPQAPQLDAGTQMDIAASQALEECVELLIVLGAGVLVLPKPGPESLPDLIVVVRADPREIASRPAANVLGDIEGTVQVEPLGNTGIPEGKLHVRPGLPRLGMLRHEVHEPLSPAGPIESLGLWLQFRRPGAEREAVPLLLKADPLR